MEYWIIVDNRHAGPYTADALISMGITPDSPVWHEGLVDWTPAGEIPELAAMMAEADEAASACCDVEQPERVETTVIVETSETDDTCCDGCDDREVEVENDQPANHGGDAPANGSWNPEQEAPQWEPYTPTYATGPSAPHPWQQSPRNQQGAYGCAAPQEEWPSAYIAWSIVVTILCCLPFGVAAIVFASMTKSACHRGDLEKARRCSERAQWCIILSIVFGLIWSVFQAAWMLGAGSI